MASKTILDKPNYWALSIITLCVWSAVGLSVAYWVNKRVFVKPSEVDLDVSQANLPVDSKAIAKLLGASDSEVVEPTSTALKNTFVLFGLARSANGQGVALISLDGKPAKPYKLGSLVVDDLTLKTISTNTVMLAISDKATDGISLELTKSAVSSRASVATFIHATV
jgi:general secretion pathway protein C